jgi:hypothetical protein
MGDSIVERVTDVLCRRRRRRRRTGLAVPIVALAMLLNLITGVGGVLIVRHDRTASGADDPATLNLLR